VKRNNSWFNSIFKGNDKELDTQTEKKIKKIKVKNIILYLKMNRKI
jgi:hypothetical protein